MGRKHTERNGLNGTGGKLQQPGQAGVILPLHVKGRLLCTLPENCSSTTSQGTVSSWQTKLFL